MYHIYTVFSLCHVNLYVLILPLPLPLPPPPPPLPLLLPDDSNWETIFYGHYRSIFNQCDVIGQQWNSLRRHKIRAITPFKLIQGHRGRYQSKTHMRLIVINSNWHPISYLWEVIAAYCLNFGHCHTLALRTTYDLHLGLIEKRVVEFQLVLIDVFR